MPTQDLKFLKFLPILSVVFYAIHYWIFASLQIEMSNFYYKLSTIYILFTLMSMLIIIILIVIKIKNLDIVGMSFLILTSIKMVLSYVMVRPILAIHPSEMSLQKTNFFGIFILFLAIETIITIRILNNK